MAEVQCRLSLNANFDFSTDCDYASVRDGGEPCFHFVPGNPSMTRLDAAPQGCPRLAKVQSQTWRKVDPDLPIVSNGV